MEHIDYISYQLIDAIVYLHNRNIIHRDIKPENILIDVSSFHTFDTTTTSTSSSLDRSKDTLTSLTDFVHYNVILSDFNTATLLEGTVHSHTFVGTRAYMAPEILSEDSYGKPADIWSYGATLFTLATGLQIGSQPRERGELLRGTFNLETYLERHEKLKYRNTLPERFRNLINLCLSLDLNLRPTAEDIQRDPFNQNAKDHYTLERKIEQRMVKTLTTTIENMHTKYKQEMNNQIQDTVQKMLVPLVERNKQLEKQILDLKNELNNKPVTLPFPFGKRNTIFQSRISEWNFPRDSYDKVEFGPPIKTSLQVWRTENPNAIRADISNRKDIKDEDFVYLQGIKVLNMRGCINVTDKAFVNLVGIHALYMNDCTQITDNAFQFLEGIFELNISECTKHITDAAFVHLKGIHTLFMYSCRQQTITDIAFSYLAGIQKLHMSGCTQNTITDKAFENLEGIQELRIGGCEQTTITTHCRECLAKSVPKFSGSVRFKTDYNWTSIDNFR